MLMANWFVAITCTFAIYSMEARLAQFCKN